MKLLLTAALAVVLCLGLVGCGDKEKAALEQQVEDLEQQSQQLERPCAGRCL